jgi:hypothetical protein
MPRERHLIVPLQQSASSRLAGAFHLRFVTGSHYMSFYIYNMKALDPIECFFFLCTHFIFFSIIIVYDELRKPVDCSR